MKHQEISSLIWNICDDVLRGLFKPHEYGDVIIPFIVLRRLDCIIEPHKEEVISLYQQLKNDIDDISPIIKKKTGLVFYNHSNYDLESKVKGNNSHDDKKDFFIDTFKDYIGDYYSERMDFYKKVNNPKVLPMLIDVMFNDYLKQKML